MKTRTLLATAVLIAISTIAADNSRLVTVAATHGGPATVQIQEGETAELMSSVSNTKNGTVQITFLKGSGASGPWDLGIPVAGPATITAVSSRSTIAFITLRITRDSFDENKAQKLPSGTSQIYVTLESSTNQVYVTLGRSTNLVYVTLESSTNLLDWADATNGVYASPDTLRFFRIRTKEVGSP